MRAGVAVEEKKSTETPTATARVRTLRPVSHKKIIDETRQRRLMEVANAP